MCELCTEVSLECISSPLICTDYLHAYLIPLDMLCSQTMCQPKLFLCDLLLSLTVRGEVTNCVVYSHVVQALANVGPRKPESTKPKALG